MVSLVIPTYNEGENIASLIKMVHAVLSETKLPFEIIVVDDDSPDRTWERVEALADEYVEVRVIRRIQERGLARAVLRGWQEASGDILAVMDGDLQHPPETLGALVRAVDQDAVDIAVASRHVHGGGVSQWNVVRRFVSWGATLAATWMLPGTLATIRDPMSGYFALDRKVIRGAVLEPEGYKILLEVLGRGRYDTVQEIPYEFREREKGGSKLGLRQYWEFLVHLIRLGWGTGELFRFVRYCLVGSSGVLVNMGVLATLTWNGVDYLEAGAIAVESAIVTNFLLNEFWTFSDLSRKSPSAPARLARLVKFNVICLGGALINLFVLWIMTDHLGVYFLLSNLFGIAGATMWNYGVNANVTWDSARATRRG